jgi:hypothetical protein
MEKEPFETSTCAVCLETLAKVNIGIGKCGHKFHLQCLLQIHNKKCPICRDLMVPETKVIDQNGNAGIYNLETRLLHILREIPEEKMEERTFKSDFMGIDKAFLKLIVIMLIVSVIFTAIDILFDPKVIIRNLLF